ncbi:hypothetical protein Taro_019860 [Colocasia esculenta]|uniref:Uncharacterized protein n=1 Tax=Colocasia esculenta TaxID=4460 RepID=A0A843UXD9_COLES|nr:hypothetical protein [Colocasia esculenta]
MQHVGLSRSCHDEPLCRDLLRIATGWAVAFSEGQAEPQQWTGSPWACTNFSPAFSLSVTKLVTMLASGLVRGRGGKDLGLSLLAWPISVVERSEIGRILQQLGFLNHLSIGTSFTTCWGRVEELLVAGELWIDHKKLIFFLFSSASACANRPLGVDQRQVDAIQGPAKGGVAEGFWGDFGYFAVLSVWFQREEVIRSTRNLWVKLSGPQHWVLGVCLDTVSIVKVCVVFLDTLTPEFELYVRLRERRQWEETRVCSCVVCRSGVGWSPQFLDPVEVER